MLTARLEWLFLPNRYALLGHRQLHCHGDIGAGYRRQVDHLLFTEKFFGTSKSFIGNGVLGRQLGDEVVHRGLFPRHIRRPLVGLELGDDVR